MNPVRKQSARVTGVDVPVEGLRPGHIVGASGARTIVSDGIDHETYRSFVVRYTNGVLCIESWPNGSVILVVGRDRDLWRKHSHLRSVGPT